MTVKKSKPKVIPTTVEITAEIKKLKLLKPRVPARTFFGDNNHDSIEAQICVLEKRMNDDSIYNYFEPVDDDRRRILDSALDARRWLDGDSTAGAPSSSWQELVKVK